MNINSIRKFLGDYLQRFATACYDPLEGYDSITKPSDIPQQHFVKYVLSRISDSDIAVDVGCGLGRQAVFIAPLVSKLYLIDKSSNMLNEARNHYMAEYKKKIITINFRKSADWDKITDNLDMVYSFATFTLLPLRNLVFYLRKLAPRINKGGFFIFNYSDASNPLAWQKACKSDAFCYHYPTMVDTVMKYHGFRLVESSPRGFSMDSVYIKL